jgi:hypothetical protein
VYLFALMLRCVTAFDAPVRQTFLAPVRQTFVAELVSDANLSNAVALNSRPSSSCACSAPRSPGCSLRQSAPVACSSSTS